MTRDRLVMATRGSQLALTQSRAVARALEAAHPGLGVELRTFKTKGDKILDVSLAKIGGKALFVKELEDAMLRGDADLAVHSMKDMPAELPEGLAITAVPEREDPRDAWISREGKRIDAMPDGSVIGTSSLRRQAQSLALRPDARVRLLRGNIDTRLRKLADGEYDAIVIAMAGLERMGWADRATEAMAPRRFVPAVGQGALAIETRADDEAAELVGALEHLDTRTCVTSERAMLAELGASCQVPVAGHARLIGDTVVLDALVASLDGKTVVRVEDSAPRADAKALGSRLGCVLLERGGREILKEIEEQA